MSTSSPIFLTLMTISVSQSCSFLINMLCYKTKNPILLSHIKQVNHQWDFCFVFERHYLLTFTVNHALQTQISFYLVWLWTALPFTGTVCVLPHMTLHMMTTPWVDLDPKFNICIVCFRWNAHPAPLTWDHHFADFRIIMFLVCLVLEVFIV